MRSAAMPVEAQVRNGMLRDVRSDCMHEIRKDFPVPALPLTKRFSATPLSKARRM